MASKSSRVDVDSSFGAVASRWLGWAAALLISVGACGGSDSTGEQIAQANQALSSNATILGFEQQSDWGVQNATRSQSTNHDQGSYSLGLTLPSNTEAVATSTVTSLGQVGTTVSVDVLLPVTQPTGWTYAQIILVSQSRGLWWGDLGRVDLAGKAAGSFQTLTFPLSSAIRTQLSGTYSDLQIQVRINAVGNAQPYLLDNLDFHVPSTGTGGGASSGGSSGTTGGTGGTGDTTGGTGGATGASGGTSGTGASSGTGGTSGSGGATDTAFQFNFELPRGVPRQAVALASTHGSLSIDDRAQVVEASGAFAGVSGVDSGGAVARIGVSADVGSLWSTGAVALANDSEVHGDLSTTATIATREPGSVVDGTIHEHADIGPLQSVSWSVTFPGATQGSVMLEPNQLQTLNPGAYDSVVVKSGAHLTLQAGQYTFNAFDIEPGGVIDLSNPSAMFIYIRDNFTYRGSTTRTNDHANVLYGFAGTSAVSILGPFRGIFVAPRAALSLENSTGAYMGFYAAQSIVLHQNSVVIHETFDPAQFCAANAACSSFCPCPGGACQSDDQCPAGFVCGTNNGGCFNHARSQRTCWAVSCTDGVDETECGQTNSPCGPNCACAAACNADDPTSTCPTGEVCKRNTGGVFDLDSRDACMDPICPSNDPQLCGGIFSLCGPHCVCTPSCNGATCLNPGDGCEGICPGVCGRGETGCTEDAECSTEDSCLQNSDGTTRCVPRAMCTNVVLRPPLCGSGDAPCGPCPMCTPQCDGRQCGEDPNCGTSCGTCNGGQFCDADGQCVTPSVDPPLTVRGANGSQRTVERLPAQPPSTVGAVPGAFSVSEQGTAQYTVPIQVPPGRAGIEPALSLQYSQSRDNRDLGVGWHLEGLSQITRCPRVQSLDGYSRPVKGDPKDRFCMDGKRLEVVNNGAYGDNGTEYRTLIDSFAKVVSHRDAGDGIQLESFAGFTRVERAVQGPDWFEVRTKDGRILTYGRTRDATVMARSGVRFVWLLSHVEDRAGNTMTVKYTNLSLSAAKSMSAMLPNFARPSLIAYTGHGTSPGTRHVQFTYETRDDPQVGYLQGGMPQFAMERLSRITTSVNGERVKNYRLEYGPGIDSQIARVFECAGADDTYCKPPTTFEYEEQSGFTAAQPGPDLTGAAELDANGDGIPDFMKTTVIVGGVGAQPGLTVAAISTEVALAALSQWQPEVGVPVSIVWSFVKDDFWGMFAKKPKITFQSNLFVGNADRSPLATENVTGLHCPSAARAFVMDYDRDGKDDIVSDCVGAGDLRISISNGNGAFFPKPLGDEIQVPVVRLKDQDGISWHSISPILFDINGDSLQDIVSCKDQYTLQVRRRLGPGFSQGFSAPLEYHSPVITSPPLPPVSIPIPLCNEPLATQAIFDVDGDGTPDLLVHGPGGWQQLRYSASCDTCEPSLSWETVQFTSTGSRLGEGYTLGDINGDHLVDVWQRATPAHPHAGIVWINTGANRLSPIQLDRPEPQETGFTFQHAAVLDYDSNGRPDFVETWQKEIVGVVSHFNLALLTDSAVTALTPHPANDLVALGTAQPGFWQLSGDLDGDGNQDLFGESDAVFYGSGSKNMLLKRVVDGLGNIVTVHYSDARPSDTTYTTDDRCSGSTWPETCLKRLPTLVSRHDEGFIRSDGVGEITERSFTYNYVNARMNVTGQGWIGFDRRSVSASAGFLNRGTVTTDYEPVVRYNLEGNATTSSSFPYFYPLAGLPRTVTTDSDATFSPIESGPFAKRVQVTNEWQVLRSTSLRLFPALKTSLTAVYERPISSLGEPPPFDDNGQFVSDCLHTITTDFFGNVRVDDETCHDPDLLVEHTNTNTTYIEDPNAWLLSNLELLAIDSDRHGTQHQVWDLNYDAQGLLKEVIRIGTPAQERTTTLNRDDFGNVRQITEHVDGEPDRVTTVEYDADGVFPLKTTNALGHVTETRFDDHWGTPERIADPNNVVEQRRYDGFGRLAQIVGPTGTTVYTYAPVVSPNRITEVGSVEPRIAVSVDAQGTEGTRTGTASMELDNYGRMVRSHAQGLGGVDVIQEQAYDPAGRALGLTLPHTADTTPVPDVKYTHDNLDRLIKLDHSDGSSAEHQYASYATLAPAYQHWLGILDCGELTVGQCAIDICLDKDEEGRRNVTFRDHRGLPIANIDGENVDNVTDYKNVAHYSTYRYGPFNRLIRKTQKHAPGFAGFVHSLTDYDPYGRVLSETDADTGTTIFDYNGFDEIHTSLDANLHDRVYRYDQLGRMTEIDDGGGDVTQWLYDQGETALGRLSESISPPTAENPDGQHLKYTYEPVTNNTRGMLHQLDAVIDGTDYSVALDYDDLGRPQNIHYPHLGSAAPIIAHYAYDSSGALDTLEETGSGTTHPLWHLDQAFQGYLRSHETFGNGAATTTMYDSRRQWLSSIHTTLGTDTVQSLGYTRYANGLVAGKGPVDSLFTTTNYTYDVLNRLSTVTDMTSGREQSFDYNVFGGLAQRSDTAAGDVTTSFVSGRTHLIDTVTTPRGTNVYGYDAKGNEVDRNGPDIPGIVQQIEYTPFDLPKTITTGTTSQTVTKFEYSAHGERLVRRNVDNDTRYFVAGLYQRIVDSVADTIEERFQLYAGGRQIGEIVRKNGADQTLFFHPDHEGSIDAISTPIGDSVQQEFTPFGQRVGSLDAELTRAGFTGQQHDDDLGFTDYGGRIYDQLASQFTAADPIMQAPFWTQGLNRYAYALNNPVNNVDPSGFSSGFVDSGADVGTGVMAWGAGVVGGAYLIGSAASGNWGGVGGLGASLGSAGLHGLQGSPAFPGMGHAGFMTNAAVPTAAPKGTGGGQNPMSAAGQNKPGGLRTPARSPKDIEDEFLREEEEKPTYTPDPESPTFDEPTEKELAKLHGDIQPYVRQHLALLRLFSIPFQFRSTFRTFSDQNGFYAKGRTAPGPIVTYARGGESLHNFGLAYDLNVPAAQRPLSGLAGEEAGLEWGGKWTKLPDPGHFQYTGGDQVPLIRMRWEIGLRHITPW